MTDTTTDDNEGDNPVRGATITDVRPMTDDELRDEGWQCRHGPPVALELSSGAVIYPSADPEGNGGGAIFGYDDDQRFWLPPRGDADE